METYKKKLEELSDLKRQVRILEEKNADYVQHTMELEEVGYEAWVDICCNAWICHTFSGFLQCLKYVSVYFSKILYSLYYLYITKCLPMSNRLFSPICVLVLKIHHLSCFLFSFIKSSQEVKKSGTWRPQLDMYKKQNAELHQKLAEEAKKTDRQVFENKKLIEKMEALMQEKDVSYPSLSQLHAFFVRFFIFLGWV